MLGEVRREEEQLESELTEEGEEEEEEKGKEESKCFDQVLWHVHTWGVYEEGGLFSFFLFCLFFYDYDFFLPARSSAGGLGEFWTKFECHNGSTSHQFRNSDQRGNNTLLPHRFKD
jgi:hypothetical protein